MVSSSADSEPIARSLPWAAARPLGPISIAQTERTVTAYGARLPQRISARKPPVHAVVRCLVSGTALAAGPKAELSSTRQHKKRPPAATGGLLQLRSAEGTGLEPATHFWATDFESAC